MEPLPHVAGFPQDVNCNIKKTRVYLHDATIREAAEMALPGEEPKPEIAEPETEPEGGDELPGLPSGKSYTLNMAKKQLDGILEQWMDLAGNYEEGEERHNFLEIGERLREISAVLQRDFLGGAE
jgi:hypothetical protein